MYISLRRANALQAAILEKINSLKKINNTPALKNLSRLILRVGENLENVNHFQFNEQMRMFPLAGAKIEEV